jgi:hypothetical protein
MIAEAMFSEVNKNEKACVFSADGHAVLHDAGFLRQQTNQRRSDTHHGAK